MFASIHQPATHLPQLLNKARLTGRQKAFSLPPTSIAGEKKKLLEKAHLKVSACGFPFHWEALQTGLGELHRYGISWMRRGTSFLAQRQVLAASSHPSAAHKVTWIASVTSAAVSQRRGSSVSRRTDSFVALLSPKAQSKRLILGNTHRTWTSCAVSQFAHRLLKLLQSFQSANRPYPRLPKT